jgi:hypothetical protein
MRSSISTGQGMPGHPCIELPHPIYYLSREDLGRATLARMDEVVRQLTAAV